MSVSSLCVREFSLRAAVSDLLQCILTLQYCNTMSQQRHVLCSAGLPVLAACFLAPTGHMEQSVQTSSSELGLIKC